MDVLGENLKIAIGADHRGFILKGKIIEYLKSKGYSIDDFGSYTEKSVDYPEYGIKVARAVAKGEYDRGILLCATGIGMSIAANKVPGIRAALCHSDFDAMISRRHNDANIIVLGGDTLTPKLAFKMLIIFLNEKFEGGRHLRRINKIKELNSKLR